MLRIESGARGGRADDGVLRCAVIERHHVVSTRKKKGRMVDVSFGKSRRLETIRHGMGSAFHSPGISGRDLFLRPLETQEG